MSREIDQERIDSGDLSDDEILYLAQRGRLPEELQRKLREDPEAEEGLRAALGNENRSIRDVPHTGDVNAKTIPATLEDTQGGAEELDDGLNRPEDDEDEDDEEAAPYEEWTNNDLRAEIARRNEDREDADKLSMDGNKATLIATLEADDEAEE